MSAAIVFGEHVVRLASSRVARCDVPALRDAEELLRTARQIRDECQAASDAARSQGYAEGRAAAMAEYADALHEAMVGLTTAFEAESARRHRNVATAAMEVVEHLIGAREPADVVAGLAARALLRVDAGSCACHVAVAQDHVEVVRGSLQGLEPPVAVKGDDALGPFDCRITFGEGRIIADLETQLASLRDRWGTARPGEIAK